MSPVSVSEPGPYLFMTKHVIAFLPVSLPAAISNLLCLLYHWFSHLLTGPYSSSYAAGVSTSRESWLAYLHGGLWFIGCL